MTNVVVLVGRLTKDPELRYTSNGAASLNFTLAIDRNFKNKQGERETDFITCQMWRKTAETFANYARKGTQVSVDGSIQTRNYENKQGQKVYVTEAVINNFTLLGSKPKNEQPQQQNQQIDVPDDDLPF